MESMSREISRYAESMGNTDYKVSRATGVVYHSPRILVNLHLADNISVNWFINFYQAWSYSKISKVNQRLTASNSRSAIDPSHFI